MPVDVAASKETAFLRDLVLGRKPHGILNTNKVAGVLASRDVSAWVGEGRIKYREDVVGGLENAPRALIGLLRGRISANFWCREFAVAPHPIKRGARAK